jgi:hypothetical protein
MRYALMLADDEDAVLTPEAGSERIAQFLAFMDAMFDRGVLSDRGIRLQPTSAATAIRVREGELVIADGPFAETKEQVGGLFIVECRDLDEAIEVASKVPTAQYGTVEVRPVWEM